MNSRRHNQKILTGVLRWTSPKGVMDDIRIRNDTWIFQRVPNGWKKWVSMLGMFLIKVQTKTRWNEAALLI